MSEIILKGTLNRIKKKLRKASYILQFLWRDVSSKFDVIRPYYTSENGLDDKFIKAYVLETIHLLSLYGFHTVLLICNGASANLKLLELCGEEPKVFPINDGADRYKVKTSIYNIYSNKTTHVIICPLHQVKNMIASLYSSRENGAKLFTLEHTKFGWKAITDMYSRELSRAERDEIRRVPDLLASHVIRGKWTRINVIALSQIICMFYMTMPERG